MHCNRIALRAHLAAFAQPLCLGGRMSSPGGSVGLVAQLIIAAMLVIGTTAQGQVKPDFSGKWILLGSAPAKAGGQEWDMGTGWGRATAWGKTNTIAQDGGLLTVKFSFFAFSDFQPPIQFSYALNGTKTTNAVIMGHGIQRSTSTATWHGDTLVIKTEQPFRNPESGRDERFEVTRRLSFESPGQLRVETTFGGVLGGPSTVTTTRYTRGSQAP